MFAGIWNRKGTRTLIGFTLFFISFLSIVLSMIGLQFKFMEWPDYLGRGTGFLIRLTIAIVGIILVIIDQSKSVPSAYPSENESDSL